MSAQGDGGGGMRANEISKNEILLSGQTSYEYPYQMKEIQLSLVTEQSCSLQSEGKVNIFK